MLEKGSISNPLVSFITESNSKNQDDPAKSILEFSEKLEELIFTAIKSATITIPSGLVTVTGSPATQTNPQPIIIETGGLT